MLGFIEQMTKIVGLHNLFSIYFIADRLSEVEEILPLGFIPTGKENCNYEHGIYEALRIRYRQICEVLLNP